jgi:tRNA A-37 threonylcarbamoyl transferase component Bud32
VLNLEENKSLLAMHNVGETLSVLSERPSFKFRWHCSAVLRKAFFLDVGVCALSLVDCVDLCHDDIWPPNIAFQNGRFCLIDFDLSQENSLIEVITLS